MCSKSTNGELSYLNVFPHLLAYYIRRNDVVPTYFTTPEAMFPNQNIIKSRFLCQPFSTSSDCVIFYFDENKSCMYIEFNYDKQVTCFVRELNNENNYMKSFKIKFNPVLT